MQPSSEAPLADAAPDRGWRLSPTEWAAIVGFWTLLGLLEYAPHLADRRAAPAWNPEWARASHVFFETYLWAAVTPLVFWLVHRIGVDRPGVRRPPAPLRVLIFAAVGVLLALAIHPAWELFRDHVLGVRLPERPTGGFGRSGGPPAGLMARLRFLDDLLSYFAVLAVGFAREYFRRDRDRREEGVRLQAQAARLQAQLAEARLEALRMQLNPHFLFNTLHAVSALVERDPRGVRRMIARLSELLRYTMERAAEPEVPLAQELDVARRYLEIMEVRFGGRLQVSAQADPDTLGARVPNLILQPLVENAVKHGIGESVAAGRIDVSAHRDGRDLVLRVRDDGPGLHGMTAEGGGGLGLRNTRARLEQLYGTSARFDLREEPGGGVVAEVTLPFRAAADRGEAAPVGTPMSASAGGS